MITPKALGVAFLLAFSAISHSVTAQENEAAKTNWTGNGDGKTWSQGSNWSTDHAPTAGETVYINEAEVSVQGAVSEAGRLRLSKTILTIDEGSELHVMGGVDNLSFIVGDSEVLVRGKLLLNSAVALVKSSITVDGSGLIDKSQPDSMAFLSPSTLNLVGDDAQINNLFSFGCDISSQTNITLGASGVDAIDAESLIIKEMATLTVDVSKYKPKSSGTSVALFTFRGLEGQFETINVTGGSGKIQYGDTDITLTDIVVMP